MIKYYKADDVIRFLNMNCPKDMWEYQIADLPTIEISEDAISREQLKSLSYINKGNFNSVEGIRDWIDATPSVIPQPKESEWVPCSERLPSEKEGVYLMCTDYGYMCSCRWTNNMYGLGSNEWSKWGWHIMDKPQYAKVVAWMPLKPWKGADDE